MLMVRIVFKWGWGTNHRLVSCVNHPVEKKIFIQIHAFHVAQLSHSFQMIQPF